MGVLNQKEFSSLVQDGSTASVQGISEFHGRIVAGVFLSTTPTYSDGQAAFMRITSDGRLMTDTELTLDGDIIVNNLGGAAVRDGTIRGNPVQIGVEAAEFDGSVLPTAVSAEGDVQYPKSSLFGVQYFMPVNESGSSTPIVPHDTSLSPATGGNVGFMQIVESKDFDGAALPNSVDTEGDAIRPAASLSGIQYFMPVSESGSSTPIAVHDTTISAATGGDIGFMQVVEAKTFDGVPLPNAVDAEGDAVRVAASLQGVLYMMPVNASGSIGTIYSEDTAHTSGEGGTFILAVRNDSGTTLSSADGDYTPLSVDSSGALIVASGTQYIDDSASFVTGTSRGIAIMGIATSDSVNAGDIGAVRISTSRNMGVDLTEQSLVAVAVSSSTTAPNSVTLPIFTRLSDGTAAFGTQVNPIYTITETEVPSGIQAYAISTSGSSGFVPVVTASAGRQHLMMSLGGSNHAVVSLDGGTTQHFYIPAGSERILDNIAILSGSVIAAQNYVPGANYTDLAISMW